MWVTYEPLPKNCFTIKVNDEDIHSLVKEEVDYDPTQTEALTVYSLKVNDNEIIATSMPWIVNDFDEKV